MKGIYVCCKFTQLHSRQILLKSVNIWLSYCEKQKGELFFETQCIIKRGSSPCHLLGKWKLTSTAFVLSYCGLKAMTLELWGQQNQSLGNKCDKPNLTKNLVHMHRSRGDNVQEIFGAIGQIGPKLGVQVFCYFFCLVHQVLLCQLLTNRLSPNSAMTSKSISPLRFLKESFENFPFRGYLPQKPWKLKMVKQVLCRTAQGEIVKQQKSTSWCYFGTSPWSQRAPK